MLMVNCILYLSEFLEAYVQKIMRQISLYSDGEIEGGDIALPRLVQGLAYMKCRR